MFVLRSIALLVGTFVMMGSTFEQSSRAEPPPAASSVLADDACAQEAIAIDEQSLGETASTPNPIAEQDSSWVFDLGGPATPLF